MRISNSVCFIGRLTRDIELRTSGDVSVCSFSLARDRDGQSNDGEKKTDFVDFVAFGKTAELISKYFSKGERMGVYGHIQTGSYVNKDGINVKTVQVVVESVEFIEKKSSSDSSGYTQNHEQKRETRPHAKKQPEETYDEDEDDLPF